MHLLLVTPMAGTQADWFDNHALAMTRKRPYYLTKLDKFLHLSIAITTDTTAATNTTCIKISFLENFEGFF